MMTYKNIHLLNNIFSSAVSNFNEAELIIWSASELKNFGR